MGWLAWSGGGDTSRIHPSITAESNIDVGALVLEGQLPSEHRAATLLEVISHHPTQSVLRIQSIPGEGFSVLITQGKDVFHALVSHTLRARTDSFRLTLNWDTKENTGNLSIEHPGDTALFSKPFKGCVAMPGALVLGTISQMRTRKALDDTLSYVGIHKGRLAVGPCGTMDYHTPILTPRGYREVGTLTCGDTVVSGKGEVVPVLATFKRTVPAFGSGAPVRLRAPYFGLQSDLVMAGTQCLIVGGSNVEYTFGRDTVLIPARHLVNGTAAIAQPTTGLATYYQLLLPDGDPVVASDVQLESLFIGRLRRRKEIFEYTTLAQMPRHLLPEHATPASQVLRPFEAITLAAMRAA